ncbi:MAG: PSD1 and planctomycete cytochrome C domain-containing protein [Acidobacteria bacterium]|nr:PSD1 and planctomycete cytochrome C domain-containing protein [Acidobacteriota bacterium]
MKTLLIFTTLAAWAVGQEIAPSSPDFFEARIRPVLVERCQGCHNPKAKTAGLDLTTPAGLGKGGESGPIVDIQKLDESRILRYLGYQEKVKMPPTGKLPTAQLEDFKAWVTSGAKWGAEKVEFAAAAKKKGITEAQRRFWAFQPRKAVSAPEVPGATTPVDAFILAKLNEKQLGLAKPADKLTLLRRATYDLTGLPPTIEEIDTFMKDGSANAFEKVIDRLLASPRYGERWGRHWLDVARYADSTGADEDHRYPDAWKYRDYVIDSFNRDVPYNKFVQEQIAGDLLPPEGEDIKIGVNRRGIVATGFLAVGPRLIAEQDKKKMFYDFVDEQIATTSRAFLGLTLDCARCHDHKFDPLLQKDYYSMASIFASTKAFTDWKAHVSVMYRPALVSKEEFGKWEAAQNKVKAKKGEIEMIDQEQATLRMNRLSSQVADFMTGKPGLDATVAATWAKYLGKNDDVRPYLARWEAAAKADAAARRAVAESYQKEFSASANAYMAAVDKWRKAVESARKEGLPGPDKPNFDNSSHRFFEDIFLDKNGPFASPSKDIDKTYPADVQAKRAALSGELEALKKASPPEPELATGVSEGDPVTQHLFIRGDVANEGEIVAKQFPVILAGENQAPIVKGSGRLEMAQWMTNPDHALVPRVMANRIWQWHFGEGLVRTPSNFGLLGEKPSHPEMLDWLANKFVADGWSVKKMHKTIMLTAAYQQQSLITKDASVKDPENRLLSHFPRRRLAVEEIRDSMLAVDGTIDLTMGGTLQEGTGTDGENSSKRMSIDPATSKRRTVYIPLRRSNLPSLLNLFDFGDATTTNEGRSRTNVAPQALFAMNSPFVNARAGVLAEQTRQMPLDRVVREGFVRVLNRAAKENEVTAMVEFMKKFPGDSEFAARRSMFRILLGSNEFIYVD